MPFSFLKSSFFTNSQDLKIHFKKNFNDLCSFDKPLILFNYGLVCNFHHFAPQAEYFHQLGHPILLHDYRGHYESQGKDQIDQCRFDLIIEDIVEMLNFLNAESCYTINHSMGVNIGLELAIKNPELIKKQILISGTVIPPQGIMFDSNIMEIASPIITRIKSSYPKFFKSVWTHGHSNPLFRDVIRLGGFNKNQVGDEFIKIYMEKIGELGPDLFFQLFQQMKEQNILPNLGQINIPTLVIVGLQDQVIPPRYQNLLVQEIPNAVEYTVRKGSHVPQIDFPKLINERISHFLNLGK